MIYFGYWGLAAQKGIVFHDFGINMGFNFLTVGMNMGIGFVDNQYKLY